MSLWFYDVGTAQLIKTKISYELKTIITNYWNL